MGMTVHYRGSLADLGRVEDFEDRVIDLALALGGNCRVWRSADERDSSRLVRGLILDLAPGQESTSLLISPEGWLIGFIEIEAAERGELQEKPWCWVKTQFGPVEGHVALVELLTALKAEFMPDLEVRDESDFWDHRNVGTLQEKMAFLNRGINALSDALARDGLNAEAAEDPEILATRIARIACVVQQTLMRPAEHPPIQFPEGTESWQFDRSENEALWDELYQENRRKQEQIMRIVGERMAQGADAQEDYFVAMQEVVGCTPHEDKEHDDSEPEFNDIGTWNEGAGSGVESDVFDTIEQRHPLLERATQFLLELHKIARAGGAAVSNTRFTTAWSK